MGLSRTGAPATEPVSLADMKSHLRVDFSDDDTLINSLITAAREYVEIWLGRALITQTWQLTLDEFPDGDDPIELPYPPLQSVTSITYVDENGNTQTFSSSKYDVHTDTLPGKITLAYGESWPTTRDIASAVTVTYVAGYGDAATDVPDPIIAAIKLLVADLYEHREARLETNVTDNPTVERLLWAYRVVEA